MSADESKTLEPNLVEIRVGGKEFMVPSVRIGNRTVVSVGKRIRIATVQDELWLEEEAVAEPEEFIRQLKEQPLKADVFSFTQKVTRAQVRQFYRFDLDNVAAIPLTTFDAWWSGLSQDPRKNVRRAAKRGVTVEAVELDDQLVHGIVGIYNETPMRQGKPFGHYGKPFETVKKEVSTFPGRSQFIGAYCGTELIGFIKMVYMGNIAGILHIIAKVQHEDKRPANAMIAKAVELCCQRNVSFLLHGKYVYGNKVNSPLTEFKRRCGFQRIDVPRYYVPLTARGWMFVALGLHRGLLGLLPSGLIDLLVMVRAKFFENFRGHKERLAAQPSDEARTEKQAGSD
jgi:hypothetical protein